MPGIEPFGSRPDLIQPILELCVEDWTGLWHIAADAAKAVNARQDAMFRDAIRNQLAEMVAREFLQAAMWSYEAPRPMTADEIRWLPLDSELWKPPLDSSVDEQIRLAATDAGTRLYFGKSE
jgi:hypothetical protein